MRYALAALGLPVLLMTTSASGALPEAAPAEDPASRTLQATVKKVAGTVRWRSSPQDEWTPLKEGDTLPVGADVCTGFRARCVLDMTDSLVQVDALSLMRVAELERKEDTVRTRLYLKQGKTQSIVEKGKIQSDFEIITPSHTLSVKGTRGIQCGHYADQGGAFGLTQAGKIGVRNRIGRERDLTPGQFTDKRLVQAIEHLSDLKMMKIPQLSGFQGKEVAASSRRNVSLPVLPKNADGRRVFRRDDVSDAVKEKIRERRSSDQKCLVSGE